MRLVRALKNVLHRTGYTLSPFLNNGFPIDFTPDDIAAFQAVMPYTQTSPERVMALRDATHYIVRAGIPGSFVECGVYHGGSILTMVRGLIETGTTDRDIWLYDTFEGMPAPTENDISIAGQHAMERFNKVTAGNGGDWCREDVHTVQRRMEATGYPHDRFRYVVGRVEDTIPAQTPTLIALLRLDTDWYESTRHELFHLWPLLAPGGVLIVDDYGHWAGARQAVNEFVADHPDLLLNRIDYTARIGIKR